MDRENSGAVASKKPQWNSNTAPAKPASPLAKQDIKDIPRAVKREVTGTEGTAVTEAEERAALGEAAGAQYQKVRRPRPQLQGIPQQASPKRCCMLSFSSARGVSAEPAFPAAQWTENATTVFNCNPENTHRWEGYFTKNHCRLIKILKWQNPQILYHVQFLTSVNVAFCSFIPYFSEQFLVRRMPPVTPSIV